MTKLCWFLCSYKFVINSCEYFCIKKRRRCNYIAAFLVNRIRYLLIARMLRLIRLLIHVRRCRAFIATFLTLIPSLMPYLGTLFCVMCVYCSLGVQVTRSSLPLLVFCSKSFTICLYNFWYILYTKSNFVRIKVGRCRGLAPRLFQDSSWIRLPKDTRVGCGVCVCVLTFYTKRSNAVRIKNQTKGTSRYSFVIIPSSMTYLATLGPHVVSCVKKR